MARLLDVCISVLGAVAVVGFAYAASSINAYGPDALVDSAAGTLGQLVFGLWAMAIALFGSFRTDSRQAGRHWWHWLVDVPFWALYAGAFAIAVGLVRWIWLRLLRAASWLDPDEAARGLLGDLDTSYSGSAGGLSFFFVDGGLVRAFWTRLTRRRR